VATELTKKFTWTNGTVKNLDIKATLTMPKKPVGEILI